MRYQILAVDYDGTLAHDGAVTASTIEALKKLLGTGRQLVLVTGRELAPLQEVFNHLELFHWVVAENGGVLYHPQTKEEEALAEPPAIRFTEALRTNGCQSISVGKVVVATWEPYQQIVLDTIRQLGLELQVVFNKGAVMILPSGVNKASGLAMALKKMGVSPHNVVSIGDAENDHAMLQLSEFSVAVQNSIASLQDSADWVTRADHGRGVEELIDLIVANDLADQESHSTRHALEFGVDGDMPVSLPAYGESVLIAGPSASGKSTVATQIVETLAKHQYQFCLIDPEGDYENFDQAVVLGGPQGHPQPEEVMSVLDNPQTSVVISMTGLPISDRPPYFLELLSKLLEMRSRLGRPHWLVLDEAHHLLPADWQPPSGLLPDTLKNMLLITVHPNLLAPTVLSRMSSMIAVGAEALENLSSFAEATNDEPPRGPVAELATGQVLYWTRKTSSIRMVNVHPCTQERRRHRRKYAKGELVPEKSFYFRGPHNKLHLRAQNLMLFLQMADGVDDETWDYHRRRGDYSAWLLECIKDVDLADQVAELESMKHIDPIEGRARIRQAIERDYTLPADSPLPVQGAQ